MMIYFNILSALEQEKKLPRRGAMIEHIPTFSKYDVLKSDDFKRTGIFRVEKGVKHRHGAGTTIATFQHTDDGVVEYVAPVVKQKTPSMYYCGKFMDQVSYGPEDGFAQPDGTKCAFWTIENEEYLLNMAKSENIKLGPKKKGLLTTLNEGVGDLFGLS